MSGDLTKVAELLGMSEASLDAAVRWALMDFGMREEPAHFVAGLIVEGAKLERRAEEALADARGQEAICVANAAEKECECCAQSALIQAALARQAEEILGGDVLGASEPKDEEDETDEP